MTIGMVASLVISLSILMKYETEAPFRNFIEFIKYLLCTNSLVMVGRTAQLEVVKE